MDDYNLQGRLVVRILVPGVRLFLLFTLLASSSRPKTIPCLPPKDLLSQGLAVTRLGRVNGSVPEYRALFYSDNKMTNLDESCCRGGRLRTVPWTILNDLWRHEPRRSVL